ncbi:MAG: amino acid-binding protein [Bacteroidaceae bacterium]|nr:amino acid-binding protein [Bacteroidaceae bacterium]MBQ7967432.1 amino acid-binding protein [Bacteroidaceae bacterium]
MTIKQVSVFLENRTGRINEVTKILSRHDINMHAFSMAETPDFGILRLIVSDVDKAVEILRNADFAVMLTDVIHLNCPNKAGALGEILEHLATADVAIEYMYAFAEGDMANIVVRPSDIERCEQALAAISE